MATGYLIALVALAALSLVVLLYRNTGPTRAQDAQPSAEDRALGTMALLPHQATQTRKHVTAAFRL
jgi:hypothetical protein